MYIPLSRHTRPCSRKSWTGPGPRWPRCLDTEKLRSIRCYGASPSPPAIAACSATETHDSGPEAEASSYNSKTYQTHLVQPAPATRSTRVCGGARDEGVGAGADSFGDDVAAN